MIIGKIAAQKALQMLLVQDDYMIQALAPDTPNQTLNVGVLPWTLGSGQHFLDAHVPHPLPKGCAVDAVPVAQEIPRCLLPQERLHHLLRRPLGSRVLGNIEVHDATAVVRQDHQHEEHPECRRRDDKEVVVSVHRGGSTTSN
jgi:hypothetical protein